MYCNKSSTKECPYSGNRIKNIKKNSLVPNKLRPNFQKRYVVILMSSWKTIMKREMLTTQKAFVKSLTRIKYHIEKEQIDKALEFIEKILDVLSRMDDSELR
jgi:hypothetical protein